MKKWIERMGGIVVIGIVLAFLVCSALIAEAVDIRPEMRNLISPPCETFQGVSVAGNAPLRTTNTTAASGPVQVVYSTTHQLKDFDAGGFWTVGQSDKLEWCFDDGSTTDKVFMVNVKTSSSLDITDTLDQLLLFNDGVQVVGAGEVVTSIANEFHIHQIAPVRVPVTPGTCVDVRYDSASTITHSSFSYSALFRQVECHDRHL